MSHGLKARPSFTVQVDSQSESVVVLLVEAIRELMYQNPKSVLFFLTGILCRREILIGVSLLQWLGDDKDDYSWSLAAGAFIHQHGADRQATLRPHRQNINC